MGPTRPIRPPVPSVPPVPSNSALRASPKGFSLDPRGTLWLLSGLFEHDPQQYDFQNYNWYVCFKNELLHPQKEKSRTCSNFEIHKNIGENSDYTYRFMYTLSMYRKGINI